MATDEGAKQLFTGASWLLRVILSPVDPGPLWAPNDTTMHDADCLIVHTWWLLLCGAASAYISWLSEQRARERLARQLGPAGAPALRALLHRNPLYTHHRPALLIAIELWLLAALIWETLCAVLLPVAASAGALPAAAGAR